MCNSQLKDTNKPQLWLQFAIIVLAPANFRHRITVRSTCSLNHRCSLFTWASLPFDRTQPPCLSSFEFLMRRVCDSTRALLWIWADERDANLHVMPEYSDSSSGSVGGPFMLRNLCEFAEAAAGRSTARPNKSSALLYLLICLFAIANCVSWVLGAPQRWK